MPSVFSTARFIPHDSVIPILASALNTVDQCRLQNIVHTASLLGTILGTCLDSAKESPKLVIFVPPHTVSPEELSITCAGKGIYLPFCLCILNPYLNTDKMVCRSVIRFITLGSGRQVYALVCARSGHYVACHYTSLLIKEEAEAHGFIGYGLAYLPAFPAEQAPHVNVRALVGPIRRRNNNHSAPAPYPPLRLQGPGPEGADDMWQLVSNMMRTWLSPYGVPLTSIMSVVDHNYMCNDCNHCFGSATYLAEHAQWCGQLRQALGRSHPANRDIIVIEDNN
ncbi:hypothetical protein M422DRAFT_25636 [Sphaerobolus stellatus SS14]|nr:hypothetical protein M422DRAFT_25636 [Sphaerobolus stellatus SS14]